MITVRGANEFVVGSVHQIPDTSDVCGDSVDEFLGSNFCRFGFELDFFAVLVRARLEHYVITLRSAKTRKEIRQHDFVSVADVRFARRISDCCCDVILLCHNTSRRSVPIRPRNARACAIRITLSIIQPLRVFVNGFRVGARSGA